MPRKRTSKFGLVLIFVLMTTLLLATVAVVSISPQTTNAASTITVSSGADSGDGSLRAALASASSGDTIVFDGVTTVTLTSGEISFSQANITIDGGTGVTIERSSAAGTPNFKLLNCSATTGTLTLNGLTFKNGNATSGTNVTGTGGGVYSGCAVEVTNCTFQDNRSSAAGAGLYVNSGDAKLTNCTFTHNISNSAGGGLYSNGSITLIGCTFTNNEAVGGNGGGVRAWGSVTATDCTFTGNITRNSANASGGGIWSNNNVTLNGCVFIDNIARIHGSGVSAANGSLLIITNCIFYGNKPYAPNPADVGAIDCATRTFIFQTTIVDNLGGGVYANTGKTAYLYNSIVAGNTDAAGTAPLETQAAGTGAIQNISSLVEGSPLAKSALLVTHRLVFGLNEFDSTDNTLRVLNDGIAAGTAQAISISNIVGYSSLSSTDRAAIDNALTALAKDQMGETRATSGSVTYGSVETGANELLSIEVVSESTTKRDYVAGETIELEGTLLDLHYSNGTESGVSYSEPGMTNTSASADTSTVGSETIDFTFLDVTTSTSSNLEIHVTDSTSITLTSSNNPSINGESITFSAQVNTAHPGSGFPATLGTVNFYNGSTLLGEGVWTGLGVAEFTIPNVSSPTPLYYGNHTITATYEENADFGESSATLSQTVNEADTVITVTGVDLGSTEATCLAHLSVVPPGSANLSGLAVTFFTYEEGEVIALGTAICIGDGSVSLTLDYVELAGLVDNIYGPHTIYAVFEGSTGLNPSRSDDFSFDADNEPTWITITTDPYTSVYGEGVTITAKLFASVDEGMTITFYDNGTSLGEAVTDSSGEAKLMDIKMPIGSHTLLATFDGDDGEYLNGSTGWTIHYVGKPHSALSFTIDPASEVYANSVTITATLSVDSPGEAVLTGKPIIFKNFSTVIGTVNCDALGEASLTIVLPAGSHNISATFDGDDNLARDVAAPVAYIISKSGTSTALSADNSTPTFGQTVTFTATVTADAPGSGIPAGTVEFFDNGVSMGTVQLNAAGIATFATAGLSRVDHDITAEYLGNNNYESSESNVCTVEVDKTSTLTTLKATPASSVFENEVTFMATVTSAEGVPSGMVEFYIDGVQMGTAQLDADGKAAYSTSDLEIGTHPISATYLGATVYTGSDSITLQYVVSADQDGNPSDHTYYITATATGGATISPVGSVTVSGGGSRTFSFSAATVKVNGVPLSQEDVDKGSYTFSNVLANHTIEASGVGVPKQTYYLTIEIKEGNGRAEYSVNGSSFATYTSAVSIQEGSSLALRAVADSGNVFKEWKGGSVAYRSSDVSFPNVAASMQIDLYFGEKSDSDNLLWWAIGGLLLLILLLLLLILLWRRRKEDEQGSY